MLLIPSIDLRGGHCVRLLKGEFDGKDEIVVGAIRDDENKLRRLDFKGVASAPPPAPPSPEKVPSAPEAAEGGDAGAAATPAE